MPPSNAGKPEPTRRPRPHTVPMTAPATQVLPRDNGPAVPEPPPALASGPDAGSLLHALRRRWMVALSLGIIVAGLLGTAAFFLVSPRYTAFAQIHINAADSSYFPHGDANRSLYRSFRTTQSARMKSRFVLIEALKAESVKFLPIVREQPDPLIWLEDELKLELPEESEITTLTMMGSDPDAIVKIVQAIYQAYLKQVNDEEPRLKSERLAELRKILTQKNTGLKDKKDLFKKEAERLGTTDSQAIALKLTSMRQTLNDLTRQWNQAASDRRRAEARLKTHQAQEQVVNDMKAPPAMLTEALEADPEAKVLLKRMALNKQFIEDWERISRNPQETQLVQAKRIREQLKEELEKRKKELLPEVVKRVREKALGDYKAEFAKLQTEFALAADTEKLLGDQVKSLDEETGTLGKSSTELDMLRGEIDQEAEAIKKISTQASELEVDLNSRPRISGYQDAGIQKKDIKRWLATLIGLPLAGFAFTCFGVAWLECRARRVQSADEVASGLGLRVIGSVPAMSGNPEAYEHALLESIDAIRTLLLREAAVEETRIVMVTSAVSGEGKTTLASHLASSLARAGRRTLLIDCDLRRPAAHQLFEQPLQPGFSEVLMNEVHVAEAVRSTAVDGLCLMPAGQWDRDVMQNLARGGVEDILGRLRSEYDFIIVDSHPVLPATDSLLIGQHVDAVLLSLLRDVSQTPRVYAAGQRLTSLGIRIIGAVVNGMKPEDYGGGYQYSSPPAQAA